MSLTLAAGSTRADAVSALRRAFLAAGLDTPALDARVLVRAILELDDAALLTAGSVQLSAAEAERLTEAATARLQRVPVQRILGTAEFWGLPFRLGPDTLVPRPDTETVVSEALALAGDRHAPRSVLDLGTGTGCILIALLHEWPAARGLGVDRSPHALRLARLNAVANRVGDRASFVASDWDAAIAGTFDVLVSNPPYIRTADITGLDPEVSAHDPAAALDGGPDGLAAYRVIIEGAAGLLRPGGSAVLEVGYDQAEEVGAFARAAGFRVDRFGTDLGGNVRTVAFSR